MPRLACEPLFHRLARQFHDVLGMAIVEVLDPFGKRNTVADVPERRFDCVGLSPLSLADEQTLRSRVARDEGALVREALSEAWVTTAPGLEAITLKRVMERRNADHALVLEGSHLLGTICTCDLASACPMDLIYALMSRRVITIAAHANVHMAAKIMSQTGVGCLPVIENGDVLGVVDRASLAECGIPVESTGPICSACRSYRHVSIKSFPGGQRLCFECLDGVSSDSRWRDLGNPDA